MPLNFEPIDLQRQTEYIKYFERCPQKTSDYSFANLWGWAPAYGLLWAWTDKLVWIKQTIPHELYWAPVGPWENINWDVSFNNFLNLSEHTTIVRVPERLIECWQKGLKKGLTVTETRGAWDYLYAVPELVELKGNRFHKKKNLLNQFKNNYAYHYLPFESALIDSALNMQNDWCTWRDCESSEMLSAENKAISRILGSWEKLKHLMGGAIFVKDEIVAYTIGERLDEQNLVIHFEKGNPVFKGVYQVINQMFLENSGNTYQIVNREQDLDDAGLRKAKLSYHPVDYIKKFQVDL